MSDDLVVWLRGAVEARLKLAREASAHTDGHWWRRTTDLADGGPPEPVSHLYVGEPVTDADGEVMGGDYIVVYDEGAPSDWQFDHIAANDPRDTVARCETELSLLDEHQPLLAAGAPPASRTMCFGCGCRYPCRTVRLLGRGYRHWPGYQESEWKP